MKKYRSLGLGFPGDMERAINERDAFEGCEDSEDMMFREQMKFIDLKKKDILRRQEEDICRVSQVLSISESQAIVLLLHFKWNISNLQESWSTDEKSVRRIVGFLEMCAELPNDDKLTCEICYEVYPRNTLHATSCGHPFCSSCWKGYFRTSIGDGPGCLILQCPYPSCFAAVGRVMISQFASKEDDDKYSDYLLRSYVKDNSQMEWCPALGCECAIAYLMDSGNYDVTCDCGHKFSWKGTEEMHRPIDRHTFSQRILKNLEVEGINDGDHLSL